MEKRWPSATAASSRAVRADLFPHAREAAALGARMLARGEGVDPSLAAPLYIRDKVAFNVAERAARKVQSN